jgi:hypothetical protein
LSLLVTKLFSQACSIIVCNEFICDNFKQRYVFKAKQKTQINLKMLQNLGFFLVEGILRLFIYFIVMPLNLLSSRVLVTAVVTAIVLEKE